MTGVADGHVGLIARGSAEDQTFRDRELANEFATLAADRTTVPDDGEVIFV